MTMISARQPLTAEMLARTPSLSFVAHNDWAEHFIHNLRHDLCQRTFYWCFHINGERGPKFCPCCGRPIAEVNA